MSDETLPRATHSPRRTIAITFAVLLVCWCLFPGAVAGWVQDHCNDDGMFCAGLQSIADGVDAASRSVGVAGAMEDARSNVRTALGIDFY